jgi:hypothetical protein
MDNPDSVSRVAPPTSTMSAIRAATAISHHLTAAGSGVSRAELAVIHLSRSCPELPGERA